MVTTIPTNDHMTICQFLGICICYCSTIIKMMIFLKINDDCSANGCSFPAFIHGRVFSSQYGYTSPVTQEQKYTENVWIKNYSHFNINYKMEALLCSSLGPMVSGVTIPAASLNRTTGSYPGISTENTPSQKVVRLVQNVQNNFFNSH